MTTPAATMTTTRRLVIRRTIPDSGPIVSGVGAVSRLQGGDAVPRYLVFSTRPGEGLDEDVGLSGLGGGVSDPAPVRREHARGLQDVVRRDGDRRAIAGERQHVQIRRGRRSALRIRDVAPIGRPVGGRGIEELVAELASAFQECDLAAAVDRRLPDRHLARPQALEGDAAAVGRPHRRPVGPRVEGQTGADVAGDVEDPDVEIAGTAGAERGRDAALIGRQGDVDERRRLADRAGRPAAAVEP